MKEEAKCCSCSCAGPSRETKPSGPDRARWIIGNVPTASGDVPRVATELTWRDKLGTLKTRLGFRRLSYSIRPGLYAVGHPDGHSPVFVTANYKMSFDRLRHELMGIDGWIMVLDTRGINVWCAAGKGTFGTAEIVARIAAVDLPGVVSHRTIILPQLGAPGVAAHEVLKQSRFKVVYGPVRAHDLPEFLKKGMTATPEMREVKFSFKDRFVLIPIDLFGSLKVAIAAFALVLAIELILTRAALITRGNVVPFLGAILAGNILGPLLLPWIPGRSFAWKGWILGLLWAFAVCAHAGGVLPGALLILPALSAFLTLTFTGSSSFTSLSGVRKEMKIALPLIICSAGLGIVLTVARMFIKF